MDYTETEAYLKGVERAKEQLALQPPDDHTVSLTLYRYPFTQNMESPTFKLCTICGWGRGSDKCRCV